MSIDLFYIILGAVSGAAAVHFAKGRNRLIMAAIIGAFIGIAFAILRAFF